MFATIADTEKVPDFDFADLDISKSISNINSDNDNENGDDDVEPKHSNNNNDNCDGNDVELEQHDLEEQGLDLHSSSSADRVDDLSADGDGDLAQVDAAIAELQKQSAVSKKTNDNDQRNNTKPPFDTISSIHHFKICICEPQYS